ncbi:hypothetical protein [Bordetella petrii]|uniref:hypothetical protein n=1 Tax=Bordetella petrii TaxID=94624 RepID=UPI000490C820|nr:hypothetical protein [Bordetella petrii]
MTTKHLAGPWSIGFQPAPFDEIVGSEGCWVELNSPEHLGFALFVWRMEDDERSPELEATVRAACAAPELLAAAEAFMDGEGNCKAVREMFRAAIAKAKGEQA